MNKVIKLANYFENKLQLISLGISNQSEYLKFLVQEDQKTRNDWKKRMESAGGWSEELVTQYAKEKNTSADDLFGEKKRLQHFISYKFNFANFTEEDWKNYWLIVQHCDFDNSFQNKALNVVKKYLGKDSEEFIYLEDRVLCGQGKPQIHGTQNPNYCKLDLNSPYLQEAKLRIKNTYGIDQ